MSQTSPVVSRRRTVDFDYECVGHGNITSAREHVVKPVQKILRSEKTATSFDESGESGDDAVDHNIERSNQVVQHDIYQIETTESISLIQIASYRIDASNSSIVDASEDDGCHHRYTVVVHDLTDTAEPIEFFHGESPKESTSLNTKTKSEKKNREKPKPEAGYKMTKSVFTSGGSQRKPSTDNKNCPPISTIDLHMNLSSMSQLSISENGRVINTVKPNNEYHGDVDVLDAMCNGLESVTCRDDINTLRFSNDVDLFDAVFEGVEGMACSGQPVNTADAMTLAKKMSTRIGRQFDSIRRSTPNQTRSSKDRVANQEDSDMIDTFFNGLEYAMCRSDHTRIIRDAKSGNSNTRDLLDRMCEPIDLAFDGTDHISAVPVRRCLDVMHEQENAVVETGKPEDRASTGQPDEPKAISFLGLLRQISLHRHPLEAGKHQQEVEASQRSGRDLLDCVFEGLEAKICRPENDDETRTPVDSLSCRVAAEG